ncbi:MAG: hypothetical protein WDN49_20575 [Acetobacteraceae bacterium]
MLKIGNSRMSFTLQSRAKGGAADVAAPGGCENRSAFQTGDGARLLPLG